MFVLAMTVVGLLCGSFTNVLIARIPTGEPWVKGSSRCPHCRHDLAWHDNVPLLSWLWLRRRCRYCGAPISAMYPAVEVVVAVLFGLVAWRFEVSVLAVLGAFLAVVLVALAAIDLRLMRLPDALVWPALVVSALLLAAQTLVSGDWAALGVGLLGMVVLSGVYFVLWFAYPRGLGFGDVKLALVLGLVLAYLGWPTFAVGALLGPLLGAAMAVVALLRARRVTGVRMPYGPAMIGAFWIGALAGAPIADWYVTWVGSW